MKKSFSSKFDKVVAKSQEKPIVIQFFATWCGPCRTLSPIMQELARLAKGKWELILIDVEKYPTIAGMYQVASIPTVHILHKGQSIANFAGVKSANTIEKWLKVNLPKSKKKKSNRYTEAERLLKQGNIPDKRTVMDRVVCFGGGFRTVGENVQYQGMQLMRWSNRQEVVTDTYINTAKKLVDNWVKSPGHYKNLISQKFTYVGTAIGWNPENHAIFATQAFGG